MKNYGYFKVAAISPETIPGALFANADKMADLAAKASAKGCAAVVFPQLSLCGTSCGDLFFGRSLQEKSLGALELLRSATEELNTVVTAGLPVSINGRLYNCAAVIFKGKILALVPASGFENDRWFTPAPFDMRASVHISGQDVPVGNFIFRTASGFSFGVEIGSDRDLPLSPALYLRGCGCQLILNPTAEPMTAGSYVKLGADISAKSKALCCAYVCASAGPSESTTDYVYSGACIAAENGELISAGDVLQSNFVTAELDLDSVDIAGSKRPRQELATADVINIEEPGSDISVLERKYSAAPFLAEDKGADYCREILEIQAVGLAQRLKRAYCKKAVIGVSGGSDSTLAILAAARAVQINGMTPDSVLAVTMPGFGTTGRTKSNAFGLMESLGCELREISIAANAENHLKDIGHNMNDRNVTYENAQARERTQILMDLANDTDGLVVGTGDMSETALGWCTYGGDHLSMYGVNGGLTKGLVKAVIAQVSADIKAGIGPFASLKDAARLAACLDDVLATPVSPELLPPDANGEIAQITEDKVGPYELHDFFLWHMIFGGKSREKTAWLAKQVFANAYSPKTVDKWLSVFVKRFMSQQFKRDCAPACPQTVDFSFSPRGGWIMPSDGSREFMDQLF